MQIFLLDTDPHINVQYYMDKHVIKTPAEVQQILINACARMQEAFPQIKLQTGIPLLPKPSVQNNPFTKWAAGSHANFRYLKRLGLELCQEYLFRFGQRHLNHDNLWSFPDWEDADGETPMLHRFPWMIPRAFQDQSLGLVHSYRTYYIEAKNHLAKWTLRPPPQWYPAQKIEEGRLIASAFARARARPVDFNGLALDLTKLSEKEIELP